MTDSKLVDLSFYTSTEEYEAESATRQRPGIPEDQAAEEIRAFRSDYRAYMDQHRGRMIVVIDPHFREDLMSQPKDWRATVQAERTARTKLSPGPDHNPVAWNPETDVPDGNRTDLNRPRRMTSGEIAGEGMRRILNEPEAHVADPLKVRVWARNQLDQPSTFDSLPEADAMRQEDPDATFSLVPDVLAAVYRAIAPIQTAGMDYTAYLALPLSFQLVDLKYFGADATDEELIDWLDAVQARYYFDPAEVFVIRDRLEFENENTARLKRPYTPDMLRRRQRRLA